MFFSKFFKSGKKSCVRFLFGKFVLAFQNGSKTVLRNPTNHNGYYTNENFNFFYERKMSMIGE
jgi:hypothetical protein